MPQEMERVVIEISETEFEELCNINAFGLVSDIIQRIAEGIWLSKDYNLPESFD